MAVKANQIADVVQTPDGWALDLSYTGSAPDIRSLFGTATLPLPLTSRVTREDAVAFASTTHYGRLHGVK